MRKLAFTSLLALAATAAVAYADENRFDSQTFICVKPIDPLQWPEVVRRQITRLSFTANEGTANPIKDEDFHLRELPTLAMLSFLKCQHIKGTCLKEIEAKGGATLIEFEVSQCPEFEVANLTLLPQGIKHVYLRAMPIHAKDLAPLEKLVDSLEEVDLTGVTEALPENERVTGVAELKTFAEKLTKLRGEVVKTKGGDTKPLKVTGL